MTDVIKTGNLDMNRHRGKSCLQCPQAKEPGLDRFSLGLRKWTSSEGLAAFAYFLANQCPSKFYYLLKPFRVCWLKLTTLMDMETGTKGGYSAWRLQGNLAESIKMQLVSRDF